jgi:MFS family permease
MADPTASFSLVRLVGNRTFAALGHPGFRRYYLGQGVSLIGTWLQAAAVRWLVFEQTQSEFLLGVVEVAALMPGLLVGLLAGALADRVVPLAMILLMECGQMALAFLLALLVWLGVVQIWHMAVILALTRICVTFELPARQVFFYELVGPDVLSNAIALNSGLFNATRVLGPALAGVCLKTLGPTGCFTANGLSYLAAIIALASIRPLRRPPVKPHATFTFGEVLAGLSYLRRETRILAMILLVSFFGIVGMGYEAMIPAYTRRIVQSGVGGYSFLLASCGVGATVGAFVVASLGSQGRRERWATAGMIIFAGFLASAAVLPREVQASGAPSSRYALVVASLCLCGVGFGAVVFYSSALTMIQLAVPDRLRGRVMGIWMIVYSGSVPLGALWTGRAAVAWGVGPVMVFSAFACVVVGLIVRGARVLEHAAEPARTPVGGPAAEPVEPPVRIGGPSTEGAD